MNKTTWFLTLVLILILQLCGVSQTAPVQSDAAAPTVTGNSSADRAPEALDRISLNIHSRQVVGHPLVSLAEIILLDENSDLVVDYDPLTDPIVLTSASGSLSPDSLADSILYSNGVIQFLPLGVTYTGPTGSIEITASDTSLSSPGVFVSFSGYDFVDAVSLSGDPISHVYSDLPTTVRVSVVNGGQLLAISEPKVTSHFASGGGSVQNLFTANNNGNIDTLLVELPTAGLSVGEDTLILVLESVYQPNAGPFTITDSLSIPVTILAPAEVRFVKDSFEPDSVYADTAFAIGFQIATTAFSGPIDSTDLTLYAVTSEDSILATVFQGMIKYSRFENDTIFYENVQANETDIVLDAIDAEPGSYRLMFDYTMYSNGAVFSLDSTAIDSIVLLPQIELEFDYSSFEPRLVASGQETSFAFDIVVDGTLPLEILSEGTSFHVFGDVFYATTNLVAPGDSLIPGINRLECESVFIPSDQLGKTLTVAATVAYRHRGAANALSSSTNFEGMTVEVEALPVVQIVEASIVGINVPSVNTGQAFQVACRIANLSTSDQPPFETRMVTDGNSSFVPELTVPGIPGDSTIEVRYDVVASAVPNPSEIFRIDISSLGVNQLPPVDNIALANVQEPALLSVSHILIGADQGYLTIGQDFSVVLSIVNTGEADAGNGTFRISTNGLDLGNEDPLTLVVETGTPRGVSFVAPDYDTTVTISVDLVNIPLDMNTNLPAQIGDTTFEMNLAVTSPNASLELEAETVSSHLVLSGGDEDFFSLGLTNRGTSSITDILLSSLTLYVLNDDGFPLDVREVLEVGSSALINDGRRVTTVTAGANRMVLSFGDGFIVEAGQSTDLVFRSRVKASAGTGFMLFVDAADIAASFAHGPLAGQTVEIITSNDTSLVFKEQFTAVEPELDRSFIIRDNPYNPATGEAEFRYYLAEPSGVVFRILTLTGEKVYGIDLVEGSDGTDAGLQSLTWDGRNEDGQLVLNGVYVAVITTEKDGGRATLKVAVLK